MFLFGTYLYETELRSIVFELDCLKALIKILKAHAMKYNMTTEYKSGDTICNGSIHDFENDISINKRQIKSLTLTAKGDGCELRISIGKNKLNSLEMACDDKGAFMQLKEELREWQELYKNKNPLIVLAPFTAKSEIIRSVLSVLLSFTTILPLMISDWQKGLSIEFMDAFMVILYIAFVYYLIVLGLSSLFLHSVEIDIGNNYVKKRRKIANWIMTVVIIPVILSWIFSFI